MKRKFTAIPGKGIFAASRARSKKDKLIQFMLNVGNMSMDEFEEEYEIGKSDTAADIIQLISDSDILGTDVLDWLIHEEGIKPETFIRDLGLRVHYGDDVEDQLAEQITNNKLVNYVIDVAEKRGYI